MKIDELREIELSILDYVDDICKENGIVYYLGYGTALGAVPYPK